MCALAPRQTSSSLLPTSTTTLPPSSSPKSSINMARRAAPGASPFGIAPPPRRVVDPNESAVSRFMREEIFSPENFPGNLSILTSVVVFFGGIAAMRTWGDLMIPA
ncbi:hypothetical protein L226DRAFT_574289 [Lentinus tigrinus ALCF2SS1-7]|uniref:uncharacterized protein n=1 Tax=Lentinus tigrinus ALCF2SS1-7 TaxID=1328758 RepID=UPI0011660C08|nr:hypothetical protein L226DRAFT_574289 [Lentinus tigrinus ALCF2SS1-7]